MVHSHEDIRDALDAIVRCQAIPEAYEVAKRFGWHELVPGIIYREEIWMEVKTAREIITRAKKDDIYDGPLPEDDATAITEAQNLVEMAEQAWAKHIRGPEVESILKLAAEAENGGAPEEEKKSEEPEGTEAPETGDEHAPPEQEESQIPTLQSGDEKLGKMEPWEGYADDTVKNITEGLNYFADESPDDILDILRHVWQFETAHKNRARILTHASEMYEKFGGPVESETSAAGEGGPEAENGTGTEATEAPEAGDGAGEADGGSGSEELPPADEPPDEPVVDAEPDAESEARTEGGEGRVREPDPDGADSEGGSSGGTSAYQRLLQGVEGELRRERVDVPKPPEEKAPELPWNWGEISDGQLQELHMRYAVCAYYKQYRLALHERIAQHCKEAADALHNERMVSVAKYDEKGKEKKVGLIEAEIAMDPHVKRWRALQRKHEQLAAADKREMEAYYKVVEALSRLESMRHNAWERARR